MSFTDNLDIVIYSVIIFISFMSFIVMTVKEFNEMSKSPYQSEKDKNTPENQDS
jgi:hypothetical protein